jgi:hypothetical protein
MVVEREEAYFGIWQFLVVGLFGPVDWVVNPFSKSMAGQVDIVCSIYADVVLRFAPAFGYVMLQVGQPPPLRRQTVSQPPPNGPVTAAPSEPPPDPLRPSGVSTRAKSR